MGARHLGGVVRMLGCRVRIGVIVWISDTKRGPGTSGQVSQVPAWCPRGRVVHRFDHDADQMDHALGQGAESVSVLGA